MAQLSLGKRRDGKRRIIRRRAADSDAAERALKRLQREWGIAGDLAWERLDDYLAGWLDTVAPSISPATLVSYRGHVENHIAPLLGHLTIGSLRPTDTHRLIRHLLDEGKSPATVGRVVTTLRMALQAAVRDGELVSNPAQVRLPRVRREPVEAMTPERAQQILEAVRYHLDEDGTEHNRLEAVYVLLLGTGMRAGEACALDWRDVDLERATVLVRKGKTRAAVRSIPLAPFVVRSLTAHRARTPRYGPHEPVFLGERKHERLRVDHLTHAFPRLIAAAGLPPMRLHDLRHGTATLLVAKGVPMRVVADILGHANPSLTAQTYAHVADESKQRAIDELADIG